MEMEFGHNKLAHMPSENLLNCRVVFLLFAKDLVGLGYRN